MEENAERRINGGQEKGLSGVAVTIGRKEAVEEINEAKKEKIYGES